jgi:putative sigma-54 modulation protein
MKITIKATGLDLTPSIKEYVEKRTETLAKFLHTDSDAVLAEIEIGMTSRHHKSGNVFRAEINISFEGKTLYAESQKDDLYAAIDEMKDKMERECVSLKNKRRTLAKKGEAVIKKIIRRAR